MKLYVERVGRVENADLSLNGITVVAGSNASGKSTLSKALYSALASFYRLPEKTQKQKQRSINTVVQEWMRTIPQGPGVSMMQRQEMRREIQKLFSKVFFEQKEFLEAVRRVEERYNAQHLFENANEMLCKRYWEIQSNSTEFYRNYAVQLIMDNTFYGQINTIKHFQESIISVQDNEMSMMLSIKDNKISTLNVSQTITTESFPIYISTSDLMDSLGRGRIILNEESTANTELKELLLKELQPEQLTAERYYAIEKQKDIVDELLVSVLDGELRKQTSKMVFYDSWAEDNIELVNVASGMKIFAILKRLVDNGSLVGAKILIIDEPETNLHPEWQLKLAELLVLIYARLGIQIYTNSHSPYFLRAMEYYAVQYGVLSRCNFYTMEQEIENGMFVSVDVTENLGVIYDKLAAPFNKIM